MMIKAKCTQTMLDAVLHVWYDAILCSVNVCCGFFCVVPCWVICYVMLHPALLCYINIFLCYVGT